MNDFSQESAVYETYTVAGGDTLSAISQRFGVSEYWLKRINGLADDSIQINQTLNIRSFENAPSVLVCRGDVSANQIALTYDCGETGAEQTLGLLDVLSSNNVKATFFLIGEWAESNPGLARRIVDGGHEIGNHSYSHPDYTTLSAEEIRQDIKRGEDAIRHATGVETRPFFRFPYGYCNRPALEAVGLAGYSHSIQWSIDPRDWEHPPMVVIVGHVLRFAKAGDIILLHSYGKSTPKATDLIIQVLMGKGFRFVTISEFI
jgi:peptidoglycan/xylan/chitin deacetylase (PgdA/CDA1 family)